MAHVYLNSLRRIHRTCLHEENPMYSLQTLHITCPMYSLYINMSYVLFSNSSYTHVLCILFNVYIKSLKRIHRTCLYEENTSDMCIWREYIGQVYMKSLKKIHHVFCILFKLLIYTCPMYSLQTLHINISYVFFSNSSYKHVLCILLKLFKYTCPMYCLQTLHIACPMYSLYINMSYEENT
jgi:hypothetical protein